MEQIQQLHRVIELEKENNKLIFNEGEKKRNIEIAKAMLEKGYPLEDIMLLTGLSESDIQQIL